MDLPDAPWFPPVGRARGDGLLMVGGHLTPQWLVTAYSRGIFPWPVWDGDTDILAWFSPDPRAVLELDEIYVSRRLQRRIRRKEFRVTFDQAFGEVITACAGPRHDDFGTWITPSMITAYRNLHTLGIAHSVEVWNDQRLVGGVYGVSLGGFFAGESMFHRQRDASKVALVALVQHLQNRGFALFDVQQATSHLESMGATEISRDSFLQRLEQCLEMPVSFADDPS